MTRKKNGSLMVVGTGHRLAGQITAEALACIQKADKVFHLCHPLTRAWIKELNPCEESLRECYEEGMERSDTYEEMVERILSAVREGLSVCAAFYGHPGVCVDPSREAIRRARSEGFRARMLPGISAEDALIADLNIDPSDGCQSFEASDFLMRKRRVETSTALILWQIGMIGVETFVEQRESWNRAGVAILQEVLKKLYSPRHKVVVYEASQYPVCEPSIQELTLSKLSTARITTASTLYVPPKKQAPINHTMVARLQKTVTAIAKRG